MVMINNVLDSLPTYVMSLFSMPVRIERRIDKLREEFFVARKEKKPFNLWLDVTH